MTAPTTSTRPCLHCDGTGRVPAGTPQVLAYADLVADLDGHTVTRAGRPLSLTPTEYRLMVAFLRNPQQVLSHGQLHRAMWGSDAVDSHAAAVFVMRLRRKTEAGGGARLVQTVFDAGYVLRELS